MDNHAIVVLNDGDTWTTLNGCSIVIINEEELNDLADGLIACQDLHPLFEIGLRGFPLPLDLV